MLGVITSNVADAAILEQFELEAATEALVAKPHLLLDEVEVAMDDIKQRRAAYIRQCPEKFPTKESQTKFFAALVGNAEISDSLRTRSYVRVLPRRVDITLSYLSIYTPRGEYIYIYIHKYICIFIHI